MSFKPLTEEEFRAISARPRYKVENDIADFMSSDAQYGQLDSEYYASAMSCVTTYFNAVRRMGLKDQVRIIRRGDEVFLEKKESCHHKRGIASLFFATYSAPIIA